MISDWLSIVFYLLGDLNNSAYMQAFNCLNANSTKCSNTLKQFIGCCWQMIVFDYFCVVDDA